MIKYYLRTVWFKDLLDDPGPHDNYTIEMYSKPVEISKETFDLLWRFRSKIYPPGDKKKEWNYIMDYPNDKGIEIKQVKEQV